jgi:hypothetical protein
MGLEHLAVELARKRHDLPMRQDRLDRTMGSLVPHALQLGVLFLASNFRHLRIGCAQGEFDLTPAHERHEMRRDPTTKPKIVASRVLPGTQHAHHHCGPPSCTTGRLRKALFDRYNLNRLGFLGWLAERVGFSARVPGTSKTAVKSAFPDNRGGLRVPAVCTGTMAQLKHIRADSKRFSPCR